MALALLGACARQAVVVAPFDAAPADDEPARIPAQAPDLQPPASPAGAPGPARSPARSRAELAIGVAGIGDWVVTEVIAPAFEAAQDEWRIRVEPGESLPGLEGGRVALVLSASPLDFPHRRKGMRETPFAALGFAAIVHPSNTVSYLNPAQVAELCDGRLHRWTQLNRMSGEVRVLTAGDDLCELALRVLLPGSKLVAGARRLAAWDQVVTEVGQDPGAFALVPVFAVEGRPVKVLSIDGVQPLYGPIRSGSYPLGLTLRLVHGKDPAPGVLELVGCATGPRVQALLSRRSLALH
ncbi:MAG: hypothetical protein R3F30_01045 [Planctomycetota bacterium]